MDAPASHPEPPIAQPAPERSLPRRGLDTFVAPGALFAGFGESAPWLGVLAISTLVMIGVIALLPTELFVAQMRDAMRSRPDAPPMDVEAMGGFLAQAALPGRDSPSWSAL